MRHRSQGGPMREHRRRSTPLPSAAILPPLPADDRDAWRARWRGLGQPWRTEPEIAATRQAELAECRAVTPDVAQGGYPFAGAELALTRADLEWLLATHEDGRGPVDWDDPAQQARTGLDLRGAQLAGLEVAGR